MIEIQHVPTPSIAALVARQPTAAVPQVDVGREEPCLDPGAGPDRY
jgi:hypothetical protein